MSALVMPSSPSMTFCCSGVTVDSSDFSDAAGVLAGACSSCCCGAQPAMQQSMQARQTVVAAILLLMDISPPCLSCGGADAPAESLAPTSLLSSGETKTRAGRNSERVGGSRRKTAARVIWGLYYPAVSLLCIAVEYDFEKSRSKAIAHMGERRSAFLLAGVTSRTGVFVLRFAGALVSAPRTLRRNPASARSRWDRCAIGGLFVFLLCRNWDRIG